MGHNASEAELPPHGHDPAPRETFEPPAFQMVLRGLLMTAAAIFAGAGALKAARVGAPGLLVAPLLGLAALLLGWAAAIHLGGGEKFDDHPWV